MDCMTMFDCNSIKIIGFGLPALGALSLTLGRIGNYKERCKALLIIVGLLAVYLGFIVQFLQVCPDYLIWVVIITIFAATVAFWANIKIAYIKFATLVKRTLSKVPKWHKKNR